MSEFSFEKGDTVLVRARENGDTGQIQAKFTAECADISGGAAGGTPVARFPMPFGTMNSVSIRPYEAEFEVLEDGESDE